MPPKEIPRTPEEKARLERISSHIILYQYEACPFCVKVRRAMKRLGIRTEIREALPGTPEGQELVQGGGQMQVPCLRIRESDGSTRWMYESDDIISYLTKVASQPEMATGT